MNCDSRRLNLRVATLLVLSGLLFGTLTGSASAIGRLDLGALLGGLTGAAQAPVPVPPPPPGAQAPAPPPPGAPAPAAVPPAPAPHIDAGAETVPANSGSGRRVIYALQAQRVWLVNEDESLHGTWLVSGRAGVPRPGTYSVFSRSRHARAAAPGVTMEYMVRFVRTQGLPIGFHSLPVNRRGVPLQTVEQLGTYQSLGCVRQRYEDAVTMWNFAHIGTPVVVVP